MKPMHQYKFTVEGLTGSGNTYTTTGTVETDGPGDFLFACTTAMKKSFMQLTSGRAVFGTPGAGCSGPYQITRLTMEVVKQ